MNTQIAQVIEKLRSRQSATGPSCDLSSSSVQSIKAPVPIELYQQLKTMAVVYNRDMNCIAGDLLTLALRDALACLTDEEHEHLETVRKAMERDEVLKHMEEQRYDPGCT